MKQLVQNYKTGEVRLTEAPSPLVKNGGVLVRNVNSAVSLGAEKLAISFAKKSLLGKALTRPDLARQVIDFAKNEGPINAYRQAMSRLDSLVPLGYSSAGVVIDVGNGAGEIKVGDRVSCARGGFASHAEVIFVPKNLCAKIPSNVDFESAAFATLGAIPLHALRLCGLSFGESIAIIGLGLLGQIAVQIAKAAGYRVLGIDTDAGKIALAQEMGADDVVIAEDVTNKDFFDAVLILASSSGNQPLELATEICREKGKIVVPGMVKLDVPREAFYHKELSLIVSKAWGAGIEDIDYELKGMDYPLGYVRWTGRRNMEQFLDLVSEGKVQLAPLITHRFKITEAERAYKVMMEDSSGKYIGVLLCYDNSKSLDTKIQLRKETNQPKREINAGLIGAGDFAAGTMLPIIKKLSSINLRGVATATGPSGKHIGDKFGFEYCTTDYNKILEDPGIDCILVATRHDLHARLAVEGLNHGKDVFVEKPLALSSEELNKVTVAYKRNQGRLMVGFNRRFSPFSLKAKGLLKNIDEPLVVNYRVNAGFIPKESWVHDISEGGGRIIGEVCHFIDLTQFLTGSYPVEIYATTLLDSGVYGSDENIVVTVTFRNNSLASITYVANGDKGFPRERVEVFGGGAVCVIDNFKSLVFTRRGKKQRMWKLNKDSGHRAELSAFFSAMGKGEPIPVDFEGYIYTTRATFCVEESISRGIPVRV